MTPAVTWDVEIEGRRHVVSFSPSFSTDRPDTLLSDGYLRSIEWERDPDRRSRGEPRVERYHALFDLDGHDAIVEWVATPRPATRFSLFDLIADLVLRILTNSAASAQDAKYGNVHLTVDGIAIPSRSPRRRARSGSPPRPGRRPGPDAPAR